jgi:hypothetical protein
MATVRVRIVILTVRITLSVCPFNRMAHTANNNELCDLGSAMMKYGNLLVKAIAPTPSVV